MLGEQLVNGLTIGFVYALLALGLAIAYSTCKVVNFAHGEMFTLGAFIGLTLQRSAGLPFWCAAILACAAMFAGGAAFSRLVLIRLSPGIERSVATIALSLILRDGMLIVFGSDSASFLPVYPEGSIRLVGLRLPLSSVMIVAATGSLVVLAWFLVRFSRFGTWMRATAQDEELAGTSGINTRAVQSYAFAVAGVFAAAAGLLIGPAWQVNHAAGTTVGLKAFTAALLGGFGGLWGAFAGGLLLGLAEALLAGYASSAWKDLLVYSLLLLALGMSPRTFLGSRYARAA